jgi:maltose alpha-D-glucosyltransferase / alpha-amylase
MMRSFHYAATYALYSGRVRPTDIPTIKPWADIWWRCIAATYLRAYLSAIGTSPLLPSDPAHLRIMLSFYLLEKGIYEIEYELNNRPDWVNIPILGIKDAFFERRADHA